MRKVIFILITMVIALSSFSCRKVENIDENIHIANLGGVEFSENDTDRWLSTNFIDTYNVAVYYRWEAIAVLSAMDRKLVPIDLGKVKPAMEAIAHVWFKPYEMVKGREFLLKYAPKEIYLVGSAEWQGGGIKLGQAEGGNKIVLLYMNHLDPNKNADIREMMHVIQHEFAHILHQNIRYDNRFAEISVTDYDSNGWYNTTADEAYGKGFVSTYSLFGEDEDFVEIISMIMVYGHDWYKGTVLTKALAMGGQKAVDKLNAKLKFVQDYFKVSWGINFLDTDAGDVGLVSLVQEAIAEISR